MSNSSLVSFTKISPNRTSPRNHVIDTITIHCVVGQASVEALGSHFANTSTGASSNYGIGYDGRIGMYVEEKDRSWCSSNYLNDNRAVTIEVASDTTHPYAVRDAAYESLIKLVADICKRNNIKELKWKADKSLIGQVDKQNMTVHRWFASKACPGDYLYSRHGDIADRVNKLLGVEPSVDKTENNTAATKDTLSVGDVMKLVPGAVYTTGKSVPDWLYNMTLYVRGINGDNITFSTLKTGAITGIVSRKYIVNGGSSTSTPVQNTPVTNTTTSNFAIGSEVKLVSGATYYDGKAMPSWLFNMTLYVRGISGDNITISTLKTGAVTGMVNKKYLKLLNGTPIVNSTPVVENKPVASTTLSVGDTVKLVSGATYYNGQSMPSWLFNMTLYVRGISGENITISTLKTGAITGMVNKKYLTKC